MKKFIAGALIAALTSAFGATSMELGDAVELTFQHDGETVAFEATVASVAESEGVTTTSLSSGGTICGTILEMDDGAVITSWRDVENGLNYSSVKGASGEVKTHVSEATLSCAHCDGGCEECSVRTAASVRTMSTLSSGITVQSNDPYPERTAVTPDYSTTIDVLFVFDTTAQTYASNNGYSLESFARAAIANCNTILSNSGVTTFTYKYAGSIGVNATETGVSSGLNAITEQNGGGSTDSVYFPAWRLRNSTAADVVCYLVGTTGTGEAGEAEAGGGNGLAWLYKSTDDYDDGFLHRYCCCEIGGGVNSYVFPHEIGHVLKLSHGMEYNSSTDSFSDGDSGVHIYSRGYGFKYHSIRMSTIMSGAGTKLPYYSNPGEWVPEAIPGYTEPQKYYLGEADKFDAARSLSEVANACTLWGVPAWTDEAGTVPQVWLPFNGNYGNHGSSRVASLANPISSAAWTGSNEPYYYLSGDTSIYPNMYSSSCRLSSSGDKALVIADGVSPYGTVTNGLAFTTMMTLKSVPTENAVLFSIGTLELNGFSLVSGGYGTVKLVRHNGNAAYTDLVTASVPAATTCFHHYAITFANPTVELFVDGVSAGTGTVDAVPNRVFQLGNQAGGLGNTGGVRANGAEVDDWRYYATKMTASQVAAYAEANPPWGDGSVVDEQGLAPAHWYKFDSSLNGIGSADGSVFEGEANADTYVETAVDSAHGKAMVTKQNGNNNDLALHPYGTLTNASEFAVSLFMKSVTTEDAVLFCLGNTDAAGIALLAGGTDAVKFYTHSSSAQGSSSTTVVTNATEQYHHYLLNYTGGKYYLYVDGALAKSTSNVDMTFTVDQSNRKFQLGGMHGGVGSHGITRVSGVAIDDFRVYPAALTEEQISTLAGMFTPWPSDKEYSATITGDVTWSTQSGISDKVGILANAGQTAVTLSNTVESAAINFDNDTSLASLALIGTGTVELSGKASIPSITVSETMTALNLVDDPVTNATLTPPSSLTLRLKGTEALSSFPYQTADTPCTIAIARPYSTEGELFLGSGDNSAVNQTFRFEDGAAISANRFATGCGGRNRTDITQTGGSITATASSGCDATSQADNAVLIGYWRSDVTYNLKGGSFSTPNGLFRISWDGTSVVTVGGGESAAALDAKGILLGYRNADSGRSATLNVSSNGTVTVGALGLKSDNSTATLSLAGGKLVFSSGSSADFRAALSAADGTETEISCSSDIALTNATLSGTGTVTKTGSSTLTVANGGSASWNVAEGALDLTGVSASSTIAVADGAWVVLRLSSPAAGLICKLADGETTLARMTVYDSDGTELTQLTGLFVDDDGSLSYSYFTANITGDVTWSTKAGLSDPSQDANTGANLRISVTNRVESATITFDSDFEAKSLALEGSGKVALKPQSDFTLPSLQVGSGISELTLFDTTLSGTTISYGNSASTWLRYAGDTAMSDIPGRTAATSVAGIAIARPVEMDAVVFGPGDGNNINQTYRIEPGASIKTGRFVVGDGGTGGTAKYTFTQTGGDIAISGTADGTSNQSSLFFGHWPCDVTYNMTGGTISATGAVARVGWNGTATLNIGGGSTEAKLTAKGIRSCLDGHNGAGTITVLNNGTLSVGSSGIAYGTGASLTLGGGTLEFTDASTRNLDVTINVTAPSIVKSAAISNGKPAGRFNLFKTDASATNLVTVTGMDNKPLSSLWYTTMKDGYLSLEMKPHFIITIR